jgi:hypothetical protein
MVQARWLRSTFLVVSHSILLESYSLLIPTIIVSARLTQLVSCSCKDVDKDVFSVVGMVTTLVGSPSVTGFADGKLSAAKFAQTYGIAVDNTGTIFVTDIGNNAVRMISTSGS